MTADPTDTMPERIYLQEGENRIGTAMCIKRWQYTPFDEGTEYLRADLVPDAAQWQPIETAPKDGTTILLFRHLKSWNVIGYGHWEDLRGVSGWLSYGLNEPPGNLGLAHPTHWMPLPAPLPAPPSDKLAARLKGDV
jgi:hypothetical protein